MNFLLIILAYLMLRFVEIMATVFSRNAWRCAWHMIQVCSSDFIFSGRCHFSPFPCVGYKFFFEMQNDLVHGWGLDFALRRCVEVSDCLIPFALVNRLLLVYTQDLLLILQLWSTSSLLMRK